MISSRCKNQSDKFFSAARIADSVKECATKLDVQRGLPPNFDIIGDALPYSVTRLSFAIVAGVDNACMARESTWAWAFAS